MANARRALSSRRARGRSLASRTQSRWRDARPSSTPIIRKVAYGVVLCLAAYLYGSVPFVHLFARSRKVDLREVGSGNVGATNLWLVGGAPVAVLGWLLDASKGLLPVLVSRRLGVSEAISEVAGACGIGGQCWPIWLGFSGGRGISAFIGASFAIDRVCWLVSLAPFILGSIWRILPTSTSDDSAPLPQRLRAERSRSVPLGSFLGVLVFPTVSWLSGRGPLLPRLLLALVIVTRRLTAALPDDVIDGPSEEPTALLYRLLYDRNTAA